MSTIRECDLVQRVGMDVRFDTRRSLASLVEDMPVTVAVDARGESVHVTGLQEWSARIRTLDIPVRVA